MQTIFFCFLVGFVLVACARAKTNIKTIKFDYNDNKVVEIVKSPTLEELMNADFTSLQKLVSIFNLQPHYGVCVGISTDLEHGVMAGCLGDEQTCMRSKELITCMGRTTSEFNVHVLEVYAAYKLVIYNEAGVAGNFTMQTDTSKPKKQCPEMEVAYKKSHLEVTCSGSMCNKQYFNRVVDKLNYIGTVYIENSQFVGNFFNNDSTTMEIEYDQLHQHGNSRNKLIIVVSIDEDYSLPAKCIYSVDIEEEILKNHLYENQNAKLWLTDIQIITFVNPPEKRVYVELPRMLPSIPLTDKLVYYSLYQQGYDAVADASTDSLVDLNKDILLSKATIDTLTTDDRSIVLDFTSPTKPHYILLQIMYLDGSLLLVYKDDIWYPTKWCRASNNIENCFDPAPVLDSADPSAVTVTFDGNRCEQSNKNNTMFLTPIPVARDNYLPVYIDVYVFDIINNTKCLLYNVGTGSSIPFFPVQEGFVYPSCKYVLPGLAGQYRLYHTACDYDDIIICQSQKASATFVSNNYISYVLITPDVFCPTPLHSGSYRRSNFTFDIEVLSPDFDESQLTYDNTNMVFYWWFPPTGHTDIKLNNNILAVDVIRDQSLVPVYCKQEYKLASFSYNHLPIFKTDHTAFAKITTVRNPRFTYALQVIKDGTVGTWMQMQKNELDYQLESGIKYKFTVMVQERETPTSLLVSSMCYQPLAMLKPFPEIYVQIMSPISVVTCFNEELDMYTTLVVFRATTNAPNDFADIIPYAYDDDIKIDVYDYDKENNEIVYVAGPVNSLVDKDKGYTKESLVIEFKIGTMGQVTVVTLDEILAENLFQLAHGPSLLQSTKYGYNPRNSKIVSNLCPMKQPRANSVNSVNINEVVLLRAHLELKSDDYADIVNNEIICSGKRLFYVVFDEKTEDVSFRTKDDQDLGTLVITDGALVALTIDRSLPIIVYAYYNPSSNNFVGVKIPNSVSTIAMPTPDALIWSFQMPEVVVVSTYESTCSAAPPGKNQIHTGGMILKVDDKGTRNFASGVQTYIFYLRTAVEKMLIVNRVPLKREDKSLIYSGMYSGAFVGELVVTDHMFSQTQKIVCSSKQLYFIEPTEKAFAIGDIIDMSQTYAGVKNTLCPANMYADTNSWLEYYVLVFNFDFLASDAAKNKQLIIKIWEKETQTLVKTVEMVNNTLMNSVLRYRLPHPGTYITELEMVDVHTKTKCSHHLPEYSVNNPPFDKGSFVLEVMKYPTCSDSKDGIYRIAFPSSVKDVLASATACFLYYDNSNTCMHEITIDESHANDEGYIFIRDAPYVSQLTVAFEISSACQFSVDYTVAPLAGSSYILQDISYEPSCTSRYHVLRPVYEKEVDDGGIDSATWTIDGDEVSTDGPVMMFDPMIMKSKYNSNSNVSVTVWYRENQCKSRLEGSLSSFYDQVFATPEIKIDPILFELDSSRSLPVYCPYTADAMLVASVYPPLSDLQAAKSQVTWNIIDDVTQTPWRVVDKNTVLAYNLAGGKTYTATYKIGNCVASDSVKVPEKPQFLISNHLVIESARCTGDKASAYLEKLSDFGDRHLGCAKSEVDVFTADMLMSTDDRKYLQDNGAGSTKFVDVPDGHVIRMKIPYDPRYMSKDPFCSRLLEIDFGKVTSDPVMGFLYDANKTALQLFTPPWHTISSNSKDNNCVSDAISTIDHILLGNTDNWVYEIKPLVQSMQCSYTMPEPVSLFKMYAPTGDRFLVKTYDAPYYFVDELQGYDSRFDIVFPPSLNVDMIKDVKPVDPMCNKNPHMWISITINNEEAPYVDHEHVTVDGIRTKCEISKSTATTELLCLIKRRNAFFVTVPYQTSTNGTCFVNIPVHYIVSNLKTWIPSVNVNGNRACLMQYNYDPEDELTNSKFHCFVFDSESGGKYRVSSPSNETLCLFDYELIINSVNARYNEDVEVMQIMQPSCKGSSDGAIVWKLPSGDTEQQVNKEAGLSYIEYDNYLYGVYLYDPEPVSYVVQPLDFPSPAFKENAADVIGIPYSMSEPLPVLVYISGGSELIDISITGTANSKDLARSIKSLCILRYYENVYWKYICNATLIPGYSYTFDVSCNNRDQLEEKRRKSRQDYRPTIITTLEKLELALISTKQPSTVISEDGEFKVEIKGGVAPFTIVTSGVDATVKQTNRFITQGDFMKKSGVYHVIVIDSAGTIANIDITLYPVSTFVVESMRIVKQTGTGVATKTLIEVILSEKSKPDMIGFWNQASYEEPIDSCTDLRMASYSGNTYEVTEPGNWNVAVCAKGLLTAVSSFPLQVPMQKQTLEYEVKYYEDDKCKPPMLKILKSNGDARIWKNKKESLYYLIDDKYTFKDLDAGIYKFTIADDSLIYIDFEVKINNCK